MSPGSYSPLGRPCTARTAVLAAAVTLSAASAAEAAAAVTLSAAAAEAAAANRQPRPRQRQRRTRQTFRNLPQKRRAFCRSTQANVRWCRPTAPSYLRLTAAGSYFRQAARRRQDRAIARCPPRCRWSTQQRHHFSTTPAALPRRDNGPLAFLVHQSRRRVKPPMPLNSEPVS